MDGIQVNFCKNSACANYGVAPVANVPRGTPAHGGPQDGYVVVAAGASVPLLRCVACGEFPPIKSNTGIAEEVARFVRDLDGPETASCPNTAGANHARPVAHGAAHYQRFGITHSGSQR